MKKEDLHLFRCPYTGENLEWSLISVVDGSSRSVIFGIVKSKSREYPVLDGVLYLKQENLTQLLLLVKKRLFISAVFLAVTYHAIPLLSNFEKIIALISSKYFAIKNILKTYPIIGRSLLGLILEKNVARYYLERSLWKDSLQFFVPLSFNKLKKKNEEIFWTDVGAGIHNYYSTVQKKLSVTFIVLERDYSNHFFSSIMFPSRNTVRVCIDAQYIQCIRKKCHILSFNDSLHYMKNQDGILRSAKKVLRSYGILFASNVMEKKNINQDTIYPISRKKVFACLKENVYFFSTQILSDKIKRGEEVSLGNLSITSVQPIFRYSFLYLNGYLASGITNVRLFKLAKQMRDMAEFSWDS